MSKLYHSPFCMRCGSQEWVQVDGEYYKYICYSCGDDTTRIVVHSGGFMAAKNAKYPFVQKALNVHEKRKREALPNYWKLIWLRGSKEHAKTFDYMGEKTQWIVKRHGEYKTFSGDDFVTEKVEILLNGKRPPQKIVKQLLDNKHRVLSSEVVHGDVAPGDEFMQVDIASLPNVVSFIDRK